MSQKFPAYQKFLKEEIVSSDTPVTNIVRTARTRNLVTRGLRGQGAPEVTCSDATKVLLAMLSGDTPQTACDLLEWLIKSKPMVSQQTVLKVPGLPSDWWERPFPDAVAKIIEARVNDPKFSFTRGMVTIHRTFLTGEINWTDEKGQSQVISYHSLGKPPMWTSGRKQLDASFDGITLMMISNWLAGREGQI